MKSHGLRCACELSVVFLLIALPGMRLAPAEKLSDWPQFRGPGGGGTSADKGLPVTWSGKESLVWKSELPGPQSAGKCTPWTGASTVVSPTNFQSIHAMLPAYPP